LSVSIKQGKLLSNSFFALVEQQMSSVQEGEFGVGDLRRLVLWGFKTCFQ
jgi:hypothetical protein